jgi:hypothetical protein
MWTAGSYAEPLQSDENPETWAGDIVLDDIHTDRLLANQLRMVAYGYKQSAFCPPAAVPGFFSHQTERLDHTNALHTSDFNLRDFDLLGYKYSLLSSIGTAGLNTVVNLIPGRDEEEFIAFVSQG